MIKGKFKPPYWYHDNIQIPNHEVNKIKSIINNAPIEELLEPDKKHLTTYFYLEKIDTFFDNFYDKLSVEIMKSIGLFDNTKYEMDYWSQFYRKGMTHRPHHHHASMILKEGDEVIVEDGADISWVHFIDVPDQKCFRFTDTKNNFLIPEEQLNGDIICFPSWLWHEAIPNETNKDRLVIAGNITILEHLD